MAEKKKALKAGDGCPQCGGTLFAHPALEERALVKQMVEAGHSAAYATNFAERHREKEAEEGVVHVCANCRYVTRIKAAA